MADGFVWYELMSIDLDGAIAFYTAVSGWDVRDSGMPGPRYVLFGKDGKDVGGMMDWRSVGMDLPAMWQAHIHTADVEAEAAAVVRDGGKQCHPVRDIPGVGRFVTVTDPQGASYLLFEPGAAMAPAPRLGQNEPGNMGWHELVTTDWEAAWAFYSSHYGWQKDHAVDMGPMGTYQTFKTDKPLYDGGMMNQPDKAMPPAWTYYINVPDVDAAVGQIEAAGGEIVFPPMDVPGGARVLQGTDPQGGRFALVSRKA